MQERASASVNPERVFEELSERLSPTKRTSLALIHKVCRELNEQNVRNMSIAKVGKISRARGGPSAQSIRNKGGEEYRALVRAWQEQIGCDKPSKSLSDAPEEKQEILRSIKDPGIRAMVGHLLAENRRLQADLRVLRNTKKFSFVIDSASGLVTDAEPALDLSTTEREALRHFLSSEQIRNNDWALDDRGRLRNASGRAISRAGFGSAIHKIVAGFD